MLSTVTLSLSLPKEKLDLIQQGARQLHTKGKGTLKELASLRERMSHAAQNGISLAPLHYRALQKFIYLESQDLVASIRDSPQTCQHLR